MEATTYNYKVVRQFAIMTVVWGIVGMLVGVILAAMLIWPELTYGIEWLSYGRSASAAYQCGDLCLRRFRAVCGVVLHRAAHLPGAAMG